MDPGQTAFFVFQQLQIVGYEAAAGALRVQQSPTFQLGHGPLHGVGVDPGLSRQLPHGGQTGPGAIAAGDHAQGQFFHQLGIYGPFAVKLPAHDLTSNTTVLRH